MHDMAAGAALLWQAALFACVSFLLARNHRLRQRLARADAIIRDVRHVPQYLPDDIETADDLERYRAEFLRAGGARCLDCAGTGYLDPYASEIACPRCQGTGREPKPRAQGAA